MSRMEYGGVVVPILEYLNSLPNCKAINTHGSVFFERGTPDIMGCINGRTIMLEAKRDTKEHAREIQKRRLAEWRAAGAVTGDGVVSSVGDVIKILTDNGLI